MARTPRGARPKAPPRSALAGALAAVLRRRFDAGLARGPKSELGSILGPDLESAAASVRASRLLAGRHLFPDREWAAIADFVGCTPDGLLREVAAELARLLSAQDK